MVVIEVVVYPGVEIVVTVIKGIEQEKLIDPQSADGRKAGGSLIAA